VGEILKVYEGMFITKTGLSKEEEERLLSRMEEHITKLDGKILEKQGMGKKRLSYSIQKQADGVYTRFLFEIDPSSIKILERNYRLQDGIIRFGIFVCDVKGIKKISDKEKRI
jgi:small subunit ribosomal protein S6